MKYFLSVFLFFYILPLGVFAQKFSSFTKELFIPPILESQETSAGVSIYRLTVQTGKVSFFGAKATPTLGYNGNYLGPTIRVRRGERVSIKVNNTLDELTTVHWHGLHIPGEADVSRRFVMQTGMGSFSINGKKMDMSRIDEFVKLGDTEIWEIYNKPMGMMQIPHSFHIHDVQFLILDRNGVPPSRMVFLRPHQSRAGKIQFFFGQGKLSGL